MKKATCIGLNYVGTDYELAGCINDADDWAKLLGGHGFNVSVLPERQATRANILSAVDHLVATLRPGDVGAVTYSGHGTWVPDVSGDEPDGRDEALCPIDMGDDGRNLVIDDELGVLFAKVPAGAYLLFVTDSCHSGSVFRFLSPGGPKAHGRVRFLPPSHFIKDPVLYGRMERAFGQPRARSDAALPGVIHLSGCKDTEYSNDAVLGGRPCGAMSYYATRAFDAAAKLGHSYSDAFQDLRRHLPSVVYPQTPLLNALAPLKKLKVFA